MAQYQVWIADPFGNALAVSDNYYRLNYKRVANNFGALTLTLPIDFDQRLLWVDGRIGVYRNVAGGGWYLDTDTIWFMRNAEVVLSEAGEWAIEVTAFDANYLLDSRVIPYNDGTSQVMKNQAADDMLKAIARENLGASATDASRSLASYVTIDPDVSLCASVEKQLVNANVLKAMQEVATQSATNGTPLFFDLYAPSFNSLQFSTFKTYRGVDHSSTSASPVTLTPNRGTVKSGRRGYDYADARSFVYVKGGGTGSAASTVTSSDTSLINVSPFNRRELVVTSSSGTPTAGSMQAEADQALRQARPVRVFDITVDPDIPGCQYGVHYRFGDLVACEMRGDTQDCRIDEAEVLVQNGVETITVGVRVTS